MGQPRIIKFSTDEHFRYLWLKYVQGVDLSVHCARCLIGAYSKKVDSQTKSLCNVALDESEARYYYLCGVTTPYRYNDNLHLAFRYCKGKTIDFSFGSTKVVIEDAERIPIEQKEEYRNINGLRREFNTCRNWRFAYMVSNGEV